MLSRRGLFGMALGAPLALAAAANSEPAPAFVTIEGDPKRYRVIAATDPQKMFNYWRSASEIRFREGPVSVLGGWEAPC